MTTGTRRPSPTSSPRPARGRRRRRCRGLPDARSPASACSRRPGDDARAALGWARRCCRSRSRRRPAASTSIGDPRAVDGDAAERARTPPPSAAQQRGPRRARQRLAQAARDGTTAARPDPRADRCARRRRRTDRRAETCNRRLDRRSTSRRPCACRAARQARRTAGAALRSRCASRRVQVTPAPALSWRAGRCVVDEADARYRLARSREPAAATSSCAAGHRAAHARPAAARLRPRGAAGRRWRRDAGEILPPSPSPAASSSRPIRNRARAGARR